MGLFGAKDMSGYWPAGRGAICCAWLPDWLPHWLPQRIIVPPISFTKIDKWSILKKEMGGTKILWLSHAQHIAPRPAGQYPDISLAPNNPWIAHPKIIIKSQDNYLLGKNSFTNFKSALNYRFYLHKGATCATFVTCAPKLLVQLVHLPAASPS